ncbi:DUF664 domain-containing protein [Aestuariimicrobium soli]|uniref:mycothiol transferase n=1 Tax=Aestuariimicrobium soli TaxID=2035834 RepID=UPI003EBE6213
MDYRDIPITDCLSGGEAEMLLFALDRVHRQFAWKSGGLTAAQLGQRHAPSSLTIAGTILHLVRVEEMWTASAEGRAPDLPGPRDSEWTVAATMDPDELYSLWYATIARCRATWVELAADGGLDELVTDDPGYPVSRRRRLVDILEENLLHTGQTSIVREAIDGLVGNDPPD